MIPVGPRETTRLIFRLALFKRRHMSDTDAALLADRLIERDTDKDDRRSCAECANLTRGNGCFAQQQGWIRHSPMPLAMMHRCEQFSFAKP